MVLTAFYSRVILQEEMKSQSLLVVKGLSKYQKRTLNSYQMLNANFGSTERFYLIFSFLGRVIRDTFGDVLLKRFKIVL